MAAAKPLIFTGVRIEDAGGGTPVEFETHLMDGRELGIETLDTMIDDGQTLVDAYDANISFTIYDLAILADARVNTNAGVDPVRGKLTFIGATGTNDLAIDNLFINGRTDFSGNRAAALISGTKRSVDSADAITVVTA